MSQRPPVVAAVPRLVNTVKVSVIQQEFCIGKL